MKLTIEFFNKKISIENDTDDVSLPDLVDEMIRPLVSAMEYHPNTIEEVFGTEE